MNPMDKYNQLMNVVNNPNAVDKGLSFGPHGGMFGAYAPSSGIAPNPYGITGVTDNNTGAGFHGSAENIQFGNPFQAAPAGYVPFNPAWGVDQNPETGDFGLPTSPEGATAGSGGVAAPPGGEYTEEYIPWVGGGQGNGNQPTAQSTPFLDSYMRAREAAKAEGPVTSMMKDYM